ncbi:hypothetical protein JCM33374_g5573 [Metschnikowia sp. JCM 33374]|nr:hypothetical protein JCM33374_g5573 [Metschnikowia sp. JCM 33374]
MVKKACRDEEMDAHKLDLLPKVLLRYQGVDYGETFQIKIKHMSLRLLFAIASNEKDADASDGRQRQHF